MTKRLLGTARYDVRLTRAALSRTAGTESLKRIALALETALDGPDTKREALVALGALGSGAISALPAIRALEVDPELARLARRVRAEIER